MLTQWHNHVTLTNHLSMNSHWTICMAGTHCSCSWRCWEWGVSVGSRAPEPLPPCLRTSPDAAGLSGWCRSPDGSSCSGHLEGRTWQRSAKAGGQEKKALRGQTVSTFLNQLLGCKLDLQVVCSGRWRYSKCRVILPIATIWYIRVGLADTHSQNRHKS